MVDSTLIDIIEIYKTDSLNIRNSSCFFDESNRKLHLIFEVSSIDTSYTYYLFKDSINIWSEKRLIISSKFGNNNAQIIKDKDNGVVCLWFNEDSLSIEMQKNIDTNWIRGTKLTNGFEGIGRDFVATNDDSLNIHIVSHPGVMKTCPCNYLLYSKWNGYQWSIPELVPSDDEHAYSTEHVASSSRNLPIISWEQSSYDIYLNPGNKFIGTSVKTDSGWHINTSIKFHDPEKPSIFLDNNDNINYVWQDSTGGDYDIYSYKTQLLTAIFNEDKLISNHEIRLYQNYPNPFNPSTQIIFYLPFSSNINLSVFNLLGQRIKILYNGFMSSGKKEINWDGKNDQAEFVSSGVYIYNLSSNVSVVSKKMLFIK